MAVKHVVVDGSNIATEGRTMPSLAQLDEAVRTFLDERPHDHFTVVVDASFEHRIDLSERATFEEALAAHELVTPPAGTIGRGDKFILEIAERVGGTVFSNDSFQEFHGEYEWLFDKGRLVGGKPVPGIGWILADRTPVRGPKSREATRGTRKRAGRTTDAPRRPATPLGPPPMPTADTPPPPPPAAKKGAAKRGAAKKAAVPPPPPPPPKAAEAAAPMAPARERRRRTGSAAEPVNAPLPFIEFIAEHPVGAVVQGAVVEFASHGAYVQVGDVRCYLPLKAMGDPPPRSAREVLDRDVPRDFVVAALDAPRRGIDLALPGTDAASAAPVPETAPPAAEQQVLEPVASADAETQASADAEAPLPESEEALTDTTAVKAATKRASAAKKTTKKATGTAKKAPAKRVTKASSDGAAPTTRKAATKAAAPAKKAATKAAGTATKAPAKRATKAAAATKATAKKAAKATGTVKKAPAKRASKTGTAPAKKAATKATGTVKKAAAKAAGTVKKAATKATGTVKKAKATGERTVAKRTTKKQA